MALTKRGKHRYGDDHADIRAEILRYSGKNEYPAQHFADCVCSCGGKRFRLALDDDAGAAIRICTGCHAEHAVGDSNEYLDEAELGECACPCDGEEFEISVGVSLYENSDDVRWLYLGCRCPKCSLIAVYGDWKNEFIGFRELLALV